MAWAGLQYSALPTEPPPGDLVPSAPALRAEAAVQRARGVAAPLLVLALVASSSVAVYSLTVRGLQLHTHTGSWRLAVALPSHAVGLDVRGTAAPPVSLRALAGAWSMAASAAAAGTPAAVRVTVGGDGRVLLDGVRQGSEYDLVQDPNHTIFTQRHREGGWELDTVRSSLAVLVWSRLDGTSMIWYKEASSFYEEKLAAAKAIGLADGGGDPCGQAEVHCEGGHVVAIRMALCDKVRGISIASFAALTFLEHLDLAHTRVTGDVAALAALGRLSELNLRHTGVSGDLAALGGLRALRSLRLGGSIVQGGLSGNIASLEQLNNLKELEISGSERVEGMLLALRALPRLEVLVLDDTSVQGELEALAHLRQLREVSLQFTNVVGDIAQLGMLSKLEVLNLRGNMQHAHIQLNRTLRVPVPFVFEEFSRVLGVVLNESTLVVEGFESAAGMQDGWMKKDRLVAVNSVKVYTVEQALFEIQHARPAMEAGRPIDFTLMRSVCGDVQSLTPLSRLRTLNLGGTQVSGSLVGLAHTTNLTDLQLGGTHVRGSVTQLAPLLALEVLNLQDTEARCTGGCREWTGKQDIRAALGGGEGVLLT